MCRAQPIASLIKDQPREKAGCFGVGGCAPRLGVALELSANRCEGLWVDDGIVLTTTIALVAAIILVEIAMKNAFGAGVLG